MKKFVGILLAALAVVLVVRHFRGPSDGLSADDGAAQPKASKKKAAEIYSQAIELPKQAKGEATAALAYPPECEQSFSEVARHTLDDLLSHSEFLQAALDPKCLWQKSLPVGARVAEECRGALDSEQKKMKCGAALLFYRAQAIHLSTLGDDPATLSAPVLMNKIMAQFWGASIDKMNLPELRQLSEALVDKEPELYAARKSLVVVDVLESMKKEAAVSENFQKHIDSARELNGSDEELFEASIMAQLSKEDHYQESKSRIESFSKDNPESDRALYFSAYIAWHERHADEARQLVARAIAKNPDEARYKETLEKMNSGDKAENIFSTKLGVSFKDI